MKMNKVFRVHMICAIFLIQSCSPGIKTTTESSTSPTTTAPGSEPYVQTFCDNPSTSNPTPITVGSINGKQGWTHTAGLPEAVINDGTAKTGSRSWSLANTTVSAGFGSQPTSPPLAKDMGESTVRSAGGGDSYEMFFWFKAPNTVADGSAVYVIAQGSDRMVQLQILNNLDSAGGLQVEIQNLVLDASGNVTSNPVAQNLSRNTWHKVKVVFAAVDGANNDVVKVWVNEVAKTGASYTSLENFMRFWGSGTIPAVNKMMFRMNRLPSYFSGTFTDGSAQGIRFDDLCYRVFNATSYTNTLEYYHTSFE